MKGSRKTVLRLTTLIVLLSLPSISYSAFNDSGWVVQYQENFDSDYVAVDGQQFGSDGWLTFRLINGGTITVANGYAFLNAPDFWNAGLIRSQAVLPDEYKIRTKIGYINYDLSNYEQADLDNPDFDTHLGYLENGMYFLTITDDTCSGGQCAEMWWHYHRKMVIDVDNHLDYPTGETIHPIYMVYMAPETNEGGNLLRTWTGSYWDESPWNWNVAHTYDYNTWYYAELEKKGGQIVLRLYDADQNIIQETTPVSLDKIFAMDVPEYLYLGEPHTDDYEGDVRIDEITLLVVDDSSGLGCCSGIRGNANGDPDDKINISDITYLISYLFGIPSGAEPVCRKEGNADGDPEEKINISDITYLTSFLFGVPAGPAPPNCP